jgi:hypothetical protein
METHVPVPIFCSPTVARNDHTKPMSSYFDISFLEPASLALRPLHAIVFRNQYVSSISCSQSELVVLDKKVLMPHPTCVNSAQQLFVLYVSEFNSRFREGLAIRVHLYQPSPQWSSFDLKNVKAYSINNAKMVQDQGTNVKVSLSLDYKLLTSSSDKQQKKLQSDAGSSSHSGTSHTALIGGKLRKSRDAER